VYCSLAAGSFLLDRMVGEFRRIPHPVVWMGKYITTFEKHFYKDSVFSGALLVMTLLFATYFVVELFETSVTFFWGESILSDILFIIAGSTTVATKMLYESVSHVADDPASVRMLVSRDTHNLSDAQRYKAAVESYAENLGDGVIAPLFYMLFFGLKGAFIYKAVNTLDSMVGYRTPRYVRFGRFAARLDDAANYLPARITALMIYVLAPRQRNKADFSWRDIVRQAAGHASPNAGYPIAAAALSFGVTLGGPTRYFGKRVQKPYFGPAFKTNPPPITREDLLRVIGIQPRIDVTLGVLTVSGGMLC
jgi:adenosylcobinamide-phosphate synthase